MLVFLRVLTSTIKRKIALVGDAYFLACFNLYYRKIALAGDACFLTCFNIYYRKENCIGG